MIIYNAQAALNVLIGMFVFLPIYVLTIVLAPDFLQTEHGMLFMVLAVATVVSAFTELFGIRARVFFMPMWLVAFVFTLAFGSEVGGATGVGCVIAAGVGLVGMMIVGKQLRKGAAWKKAQRKLVECQQLNDPSQKKFWKQFKLAFHVPPKNKYDAHICYHNYQCLELLKNCGVNWPVIDSLMQSFSEGTHDENSIAIDPKQIEELNGLIKRPHAG